MRSGLCCLPQRNGPWMASSPRTSSSSDIICGAGRSGYSAHGTHAAAACRIPAFVSCVTTPTSIWRSVAPEICHVWGRDAAELRPAGPLRPECRVILRVLGLDQTSCSLNSASSCWKTVIGHGGQATMGNDETQITSSSFLGATVYWTRQYCLWPHKNSDPMHNLPAARHSRTAGSNARLLLLWTPAGGGIKGWWWLWSLLVPGGYGKCGTRKVNHLSFRVTLQLNATQKRCTLDRVPKYGFGDCITETQA